METKKFSIVQALQFGFYTVIENILFFLALWLICLGVFLVGLIIATIVSYFPFLNTIIAFLRENDSTAMYNLTVPQNYLQLDIRSSSALGIGTLIFCFILELLYRFLSLGFTRIGLDFYDYQTSSIRQLFSGLPLLFTGFILGIIYKIIVSFGMILLIVPGIIFMIKYGFYELILVDKKTGILDSLRQSAELTNGAKWQVFGLLFVFSIIKLLSMLFMGLGLLITYPAFILAQTYVYRKLNALPIVKEQNNQ
jgi:uncharacterized membrane protein